MPSEVGLVDLFDGGLRHDAAALPPPSRIVRLGRLPRFALWSAIAGAVVAALVVPAVLPPTIAARQAAYAWDDLPSALPLDAALQLSRLSGECHGHLSSYPGGSVPRSTESMYTLSRTTSARKLTLPQTST